MRRFLFCSAAMAALVCLSHSAQAQVGSYPTKPVTIRIAYPPGGPADVAIRSYTSTLASQLGQPVLVENLSGASGSIATSSVLRSAADGQTLLGIVGFDVITAPTIVPSVKYKPEDLRAVAITQLSELVLVSGPKHAFKSADDLIDYAKANPGKVTVANWGNGSITHVAAAEFAEKAGIKLLQVPYKGAAPVLTDVISGNVDITFFPLAGPLLGQIKAGNLKPIAIAGERRSQDLPDVPTISESRSVRSFVYTIWSGIFAPRATPEATITRLNAVLGSHMASDAWRAEQVAVGATLLTPLTVKQTDAFYKSEVQKVEAAVKSLPLEPKQ